MTRSAFSLAALCLLIFVSAPASAQSLSPTLQKIKDAGTITIGHQRLLGAVLLSR
ncbi:hypothetical protein [Bradyrhizobium sp.]|jgi:ascorbate-specific PTS system EIIC-type component UlaA|uniref:hypothetical protein n=1 Tax=Bradyrhizobium sp. TaxID=376 RepID=UPI003C1808A0